MSEARLYKIVKPYPGFEVGQVITVASAQRFEDMEKQGYGVPYTPEEVKAAPEKAVTKSASKKKTAKL